MISLPNKRMNSKSWYNFLLKVKDMKTSKRLERIRDLMLLR